MFERYTEKARRVIFFARYEALQFGSQIIAPEHILLGLVREDKTMANRFLASRAQFNAESVRREIESRSVLREKIPQSAEVRLSPETKRILAFAFEESERLQCRFIGTEHLLLGLLREEGTMAAEILAVYGIRLASVRDELVKQGGVERVKREASALSEFSRDLTNDAISGRLDPLIGRETEVERVIEILCRRTKNNPILLGEPGVGKTAIIEGLAQKIVNGDVPSFLQNKRLLMLDLSLIVAGTKYRGQFEERLKNIIRELVENPNYIIFIDELHTLVGAGSAEGTLDAANILKPALSRGEIQCIGATTPREFRRTIERDRALERRFQAVKVLPPSEEEALRIVEGLSERYEAFHEVYYTPEALEAAVYQTSRYIPERFLPDKAIDVLDEAGARVKLRAANTDDLDELNWKETVDKWKRSTTNENAIGVELSRFAQSFASIEVTREDVEAVISRWTGIPIGSLKETDSQKLLRIESELQKRVVSQITAISALARAIRRSRAGLKNPHRPVGSFLFLGPTGVGKTEIAKNLAEFLFGSERAMIRFDMSEYMEKHAVAKLIGAPPGYVGHEEGGQLTERIKRAPYSVVLFDEIEKAHPDLFNVLLQVFEDGILTDSHGNAVDCKNAIFIMTSNIGARFIQKRGTMGFQANADTSREKMEDMVMSAVKQTFSPEFLNRLDEQIIFEELTNEDLLAIVDLQVGQLNKMLEKQGLQITLNNEAKGWLVDKTCTDRAYGARPLRRALQKYVEDPLSDSLIEGTLKRAELVEAFVEDDKLNFRIISTISEADAIFIG
jgi:ATP-dependent Clp protease ATP-binding subunit ClpC